MRKWISILIFCSSLSIRAQVISPDSLIQFSGLVMTSDSLMAVPYAGIWSITRNNGTSCDYNGFFSFVAAKGDTIRISALGYKDQIFTIPTDLTETKYSVIQLLTRDTIFVAETIIYPWPSKEEFRDAFLALDIPDDEYETARKNLEREAMKEMGEAMAMDADMNADYQTKALQQKIYYAGQYPPMRIFDVFAWKEFFEAWKRGDFKNE
jgi:hypothetical protein